MRILLIALIAAVAGGVIAVAGLLLIPALTQSQPPISGPVATIEYSDASGAGAFILPNDRVNVVLVRASTGERETILKDIRVVAIDQAAGGKAAQNQAAKKTATLQVSPASEETLKLSRLFGSLELELRPITAPGR